MAVFPKTFFSKLTYETVMRLCNDESSAVSRIATEDGKPLMHRLDAKQADALAFGARMENAFEKRAEAGAALDVSTRRFGGAVKMALALGRALDLLNFDTKFKNALSSMAESLSPRLAELTEPPAKEVKHFLDTTAKAYRHDTVKFAEACEMVKVFDAEWFALSKALTRLVRMAKVLQAADGLKVSRRKRKSKVVATTPDPVVTPETPVAAILVLIPTPAAPVAPNAVGAPDPVDVTG